MVNIPYKPASYFHGCAPIARPLVCPGPSVTQGRLRRVAKEVEVLYSGMQSAPKSDALRRNLGRSFLAHLVCKSGLFGALSLQHQAEAFIAADECGKQITCLQACLLFGSNHLSSMLES